MVNAEQTLMLGLVELGLGVVISTRLAELKDWPCSNCFKDWGLVGLKQVIHKAWLRHYD